MKVVIQMLQLLERCESCGMCLGSFRLDYGGLVQFCSTHANMEFLSNLVISQ